MAQDNSPARRQARKLELKLERKSAISDPSKRFLIVCEGKETERQYLEGVRCYRSLPKAKISVHHAGVTQPRQIVDAAWNLFLNGSGRQQCREFDFVVAVFDRDEHSSYHDALNYALALDARGELNDDDKPVRFLPIPTNSCIELWLLLHFEDVLSPLHRKECYKRVGKYIKNYDKGMKGVFESTLPLLPVAMNRAHRLMTRTLPRKDGPWTGMHLLMRLLLNSPENNLPLPHPIDSKPPWLDTYLGVLGTRSE